MILDLSSLKKAIKSLGNSIDLALSDDIKNNNDDVLIETVRAGVIQGFEFTYELCWKFMKRWIKNNIGRDSAEGVTRRELFRIALENKLITDIDKWMEYHDARNQTSHIYNQGIAEDVFEISQGFLKQAKLLLKSLEERNN